MPTNNRNDMAQDLYYTPPSQNTFEEIKNAAIGIWDGYDDTHGYATEKKNRIKDLENVGDNYAYMVAMFDHVNSAELYAKLSDEAREELNKHLTVSQDD